MPREEFEKFELYITAENVYRHFPPTKETVCGRASRNKMPDRGIGKRRMFRRSAVDERGKFGKAAE